jgi:hypothetical protein
MAGTQQALIEIETWKGMDNLTTDDMRVPSGYFRVFNNFDIDDEGMIHGRNGIQELVLSGNWHSLWSSGRYLYGVRNLALVKAWQEGAWTATVILPGVGPSRMNYVKVYDRIFFSNRRLIGYIDEGVAYAFPDPRPQHQRMVGGELIEFYNGALYAVQGEMIFRSCSGNYIMEMEVDHNFGVIGGPVTMLVAVKDGIYISAGDRVLFCQGPDIFANYHQVSDAPAVMGSAVGIEGKLSGERIAVWSTKVGVYMGLPGGQIKEVTQGHYGVVGATGGMASYIWPNGYWQYAFMADLVSTEVSLKGILPMIESAGE